MPAEKLKLVWELFMRAGTVLLLVASWKLLPSCISLGMRVPDLVECLEILVLASEGIANPGYEPGL